MLERDRELRLHVPRCSERAHSALGQSQALGDQRGRNSPPTTRTERGRADVPLIGYASGLRERGKEGPCGPPAGSRKSLLANKADVTGYASLECSQSSLLFARAQRSTPRTAKNLILPGMTPQVLVVQRADGDRCPPIDDLLHLQPPPHARRHPPSRRERTLRRKRGRGTGEQAGQPPGSFLEQESFTRRYRWTSVATNCGGQDWDLAKGRAAERAEPRRGVERSLNAILADPQPVASRGQVHQPRPARTTPCGSGPMPRREDRLHQLAPCVSMSSGRARARPHTGAGDPRVNLPRVEASVSSCRSSAAPRRRHSNGAGTTSGRSTAKGRGACARATRTRRDRDTVGRATHQLADTHTRCERQRWGRAT